MNVDFVCARQSGKIVLKRNTAIKGANKLLYEGVNGETRYHDDSRKNGQWLPEPVCP